MPYLVRRLTHALLHGVLCQEGVAEELAHIGVDLPVERSEQAPFLAAGEDWVADELPLPLLAVRMQPVETR